MNNKPPTGTQFIGLLLFVLSLSALVLSLIRGITGAFRGDWSTLVGYGIIFVLACGALAVADYLMESESQRFARISREFFRGKR